MSVSLYSFISIRHGLTYQHLEGSEGWPFATSCMSFRFTQETYRAFLLHLQIIEDVILLWRAGRPLPLQTQPGHPRHLQLWREGWQWHTAWGEQVHHFTELAGEGRERQRMGKNGRKRREKHRQTDEDSGWKKQRYNNGQQRGCHSGNNSTLMHPYLTPMSFLAARRKEYLDAGESLVTLYCFWAP